MVARDDDWNFLGSKEHHETTFRKIFTSLTNNGKFVRPRNQLVLEVENFSYELSPYVRFQNFESRKFNLDYIKSEFLWYLKGDRFDLSICEHAKIWRSIIDSDGSLNSNYGQYIFGRENQFARVVNILSSDKDSRRASMAIFAKEHTSYETNDVPCTYSLNFRIRSNKLNMSVHMRSQDAVFGMGNDAATFSFIHEMVFNALKRVYPDIEYGSYFHVCDSFHVYERHFELIEKIVKQDLYSLVLCPKISGPEEVDFLRANDYSSIPEYYDFTKWLLNKVPMSE